MKIQQDHRDITKHLLYKPLKLNVSVVTELYYKRYTNFYETFIKLPIYDTMFLYGLKRLLKGEIIQSKKENTLLHKHVFN